MIQFILVICGLPASGKSALADRIQRSPKVKAEIVRTDDWRDDSYYHDWKPEKERIVRQKALNKVNQLVGQGINVIHDDTNYYTSMRHELFEIALESKCGFTIIHVTTPVKTALKWNRNRPNTNIPDSVIEDIFERFDNPGRRYLWDYSDLEIDMERDDVDDALHEIEQILDGLEPAIKPRPSVITATEYERLDVITRSIVSEFLKEHPEQRGNREVSVVRRDILRIASEREIPIIELHDILWDALSKLQ